MESTILDIAPASVSVVRHRSQWSGIIFDASASVAVILVRDLESVPGADISHEGVRAVGSRRVQLLKAAGAAGNRRQPHNRPVATDTALFGAGLYV